MQENIEVLVSNQLVLQNHGLTIKWDACCLRIINGDRSVTVALGFEREERQDVYVLTPQASRCDYAGMVRLYEADSTHRTYEDGTQGHMLLRALADLLGYEVQPADPLERLRKLLDIDEDVQQADSETERSYNKQAIDSLILQVRRDLKEQNRVVRVIHWTIHTRADGTFLRILFDVGGQEQVTREVRM